jgi:hypothetical protein
MDADRDDFRPRLTTFKGATARTLTVTIKDAEGAVVDLTDLTLTVSAREGGTDGTVVVDAKAMTVDAPTSGVATFSLDATEAGSDRELDAQVRTEDGSGNVDFTQQFRLIILPAVEGAS